MALTVPDTADLLEHIRRAEWVDDEEEAFAELMLQYATDLLQLLSGVSDQPEDPVLARIVKVGIMALAHSLLVSSEDREAEYSPFSSERIGSYSYSKAVEAVAAVRSNLGADIEEFAIALRFLRPTTSAISGQAEPVFPQSYTEWQKMRGDIISLDPLHDIYGG